jgi:hypothetical protein
MIDNPGAGRATSLSDLFGSADGLTRVSQVFVDTVGKELSPDALQVLMFLEQNGSPDLAAEILAKKRYMASTGDLEKFIEKLSPAQHAKDMLEAQARIRAENMKV